MKLADILDTRIIDLELQSKTKDEALQDMSQLLLDAGYIDEISGFKDDIYEREKEGITGIGHGIAIPHGKSDAVKKIGICIGRVRNEIEWESIDEKPVNLIFLFCVSNDTGYARNHMQLLAEIAGKLGNDHRIAQLLQAKTKGELIRVLTD